MVYPLEGIRVLDLSRVVSGPFATRMMSDLGADVVKVEAPDGDLGRVWGENRNGLSGFYTQQNAGKRNISLDLTAQGASALVLRLAAVADVMVENFRPGVLDRRGIGWGVLSEASPRLVLLSITGFGQTGPSSRRQAFAPIVHAESGLLARQAFFDGASPTDPVLSIADTNAALHGLVAILAGLRLRDRTGCGQHIDLSMLDAMLATDDYAHHALDGSPVRRLGGEVWDAPGGSIMIAGEFRNTWVQARRTFGLDDPVDPSADLPTKETARRRVVGQWIAGFADRSSLLAALEEANLAWADVRTQPDAFASPPAVIRGMVAEIDDRGGASRRVVQSPYRFSSAEAGVRGSAPRRGEHNAEVLAEWLRMTPAEIARLHASGVLDAEPSS